MSSRSSSRRSLTLLHLGISSPHPILHRLHCSALGPTDRSCDSHHLSSLFDIISGLRRATLSIPHYQNWCPRHSRHHSLF
ncbi:hypothetical protein BCV70DRAFT_33978 [Testicularia cyperi]|uniref:Uncharacterized protein n=1 Tax=Testicularia cyperi TaxID=1882483 RepID=A0A317XMI0_9BASI|nr:hypothetical protein BCV70DRAFT_33978 [Testicularia cyperi]